MVFSGLTSDSTNGLFYGIGNDHTRFPTLYAFSLSGPVTTPGSDSASERWLTTRTAPCSGPSMGLSAARL
jgi:hypothetical protein